MASLDECTTCQSAPRAARRAKPRPSRSRGDVVLSRAGELAPPKKGDAVDDKKVGAVIVTLLSILSLPAIHGATSSSAFELGIDLLTVCRLLWWVLRFGGVEKRWRG